MDDSCSGKMSQLVWNIYYILVYRLKQFIKTINAKNRLFEISASLLNQFFRTSAHLICHIFILAYAAHNALYLRIKYNSFPPGSGTEPKIIICIRRMESEKSTSRITCRAVQRQKVAGIYLAQNRSETMVMASILLFIMAMLKTGQDISELEREKQEALATNRTKTNFLANMSHEIRTPINTIIGMNQMILRESTQEEILEYASNVDNASKLLVTLVNDILDFSKIESGKIKTYM